MDGREGTDGIGNSEEVDGGEGDSGGDGGERGCECDSNLDDGEQLLHHEDTVDIRFTLLLKTLAIAFIH